MKSYTLPLLLAARTFAHGIGQTFLASDASSNIAQEETWLSKYGKPTDMPFSGALSFSHLPYAICLQDESIEFDIAILGFPFDTAVSYRPGARFGPYAIRSGSRRQRDIRGYTLAWGINPFDSGIKIIDCGDVCVNFGAFRRDAKCTGFKIRSQYLLSTMPSL